MLRLRHIEFRHRVVEVLAEGRPLTLGDLEVLRAASTSKALEQEIATLRGLDIEPFSAESRVREHVHRLDPTVESAVLQAVTTVQGLHERTIENLRSRNSIDTVVVLEGVVHALVDLRARVDADITRSAGFTPFKI